tara:strand:+ start:280 stop:1092 length:813 start_codon:yes stop_codon:yes gene_type:complete
MFKTIEKIAQKYIERGNLRKSGFYFFWKFLKSIPMITNPKMINLYSRSLFRKTLSGDYDDIYSQWIQSFQGSPENNLSNLYLQDPLPWMYVKAIHYMEFFLKKRKDTVVIEYGGGTSTLWFSKFADTVVTIESDVKWAEELQKIIKLKDINNVKLNCIPPTKIMDNDDMNFLSYFKSYEGLSFKNYCTFDPLEKNQKADIILIDGECRVQCLKKSINFIKKNGIIVFDNSSRERYKKSIDELKKKYLYHHFEGPTTYGQGYDSTTIFVIN